VLFLKIEGSNIPKKPLSGKFSGTRNKKLLWKKKFSEEAITFAKIQG
jgi:hypothetical protein